MAHRENTIRGGAKSVIFSVRGGGGVGATATYNVMYDFNKPWGVHLLHMYIDMVQQRGKQ